MLYQLSYVRASSPSIPQAPGDRAATGSEDAGLETALPRLATPHPDIGTPEGVRIVPFYAAFVDNIGGSC